MQVQPYLSFEGRCEEAVEFYRRRLGAEVILLKRYSDNPEPEGGGMPMSLPPDKVMHVALRFGDTTVMASDGMCQGQSTFQGFSLSLTAPNDAETARLFDAIATDGGQIRMPLARTFFTSSFGMATDRFGVSWMVLTAPENS